MSVSTRFPMHDIRNLLSNINLIDQQDNLYYTRGRVFAKQQDETSSISTVEAPKKEDYADSRGRVWTCSFTPGVYALSTAMEQSGAHDIRSSSDYYSYDARQGSFIVASGDTAGTISGTMSRHVVEQMLKQLAVSKSDNDILASLHKTIRDFHREKICSDDKGHIVSGTTCNGIIAKQGMAKILNFGDGGVIHLDQQGNIKQAFSKDAKILAEYGRYELDSKSFHYHQEVAAFTEYFDVHDVITTTYEIGDKFLVVSDSVLHMLLLDEQQQAKLQTIVQRTKTIQSPYEIYNQFQNLLCIGCEDKDGILRDDVTLVYHDTTSITN